MKVTLLRNVLEDRNLSMKLYADRIVQALGARCEVRQVRPWWPSWAAARRAELPAKALDYLARYGVYPIRARREHGDVFHVVDHAYGHLLAVLPPERTVVTCHDLILVKLARGELGDGHPRYRVARRVFQFSVGFLRRAAVVVAVSEATARDVARHLSVPPERVRVIPHGVDRLLVPPPDARARTAARRRFELDGRPVLLHVGNSWFYKNLEGVLHALALLRGSPAPLLLKVGSPLTEGQRERARALGVLDRVREVGLLDGESLRAAYWAADVLVFPSLWEGFGWPVLEAMACGTPVVCSDRGGLPEVVCDAGLLLDPSDPAAIADAVRAVLEDPRLRMELAARGLERARAFTWERVGAALYDIYYSVAGGSA